jgi:hypothetical protein
MDRSPDRQPKPPAAKTREIPPIIPVLAALCGGLAVMCAVLAFAWTRAHDTARRNQSIIDCYRDAADQSRVPQDRECPAK